MGKITTIKIPSSEARQEWIALLRYRYDHQQTETLDHKECKEIADLLEAER